MKTRIIACAVTALFFTQNVAAEQTMSGFGVNYCADIIDFYDNSETDQKASIKMHLGEWALGYMSGRNRQLKAASRKSLPDQSSDDLAIRVIDECRNAPDKLPFQIVDEIFVGLPAYSEQKS